MLVWILFIGAAVGFMIALAVSVGRLAAQDYAWRAIAAERRELQAVRRAERERAEAAAGPYSY